MSFHDALRALRNQFLGALFMAVGGLPLWLLAGAATGHTDELWAWAWWYPLGVAGLMIWSTMYWAWTIRDLFLRTIKQRRRRRQLQESEFRD